MKVNTGPTRRRKHKKILKATKGMRLAKSKHYKVAHEAYLHQGQHEYIGRKLRKRDMRKLWIQRITAGLATIENGPSYSVFIKSLKDKQVEINRKMLAHMVVTDIESFKKVVATVYGK